MYKTILMCQLLLCLGRSILCWNNFWNIRNLKALRIIPGISGNKNKNEVLDSSDVNE